MSGGSFDYLCYKDPSELFYMLDKVQDMSDAIAELGYASDVARETQELLMNFRVFENRIQASLTRLSPMWKAMEWWQSCDTGEDDFKESLDKFRGVTNAQT